MLITYFIYRRYQCHLQCHHFNTVDFFSNFPTPHKSFVKLWATTRKFLQNYCWNKNFDLVVFQLWKLGLQTKSSTRMRLYYFKVFKFCLKLLISRYLALNLTFDNDNTKKINKNDNYNSFRRGCSSFDVFSAGINEIWRAINAFTPAEFCKVTSSFFRSVLFIA